MLFVKPNINKFMAWIICVKNADENVSVQIKNLSFEIITVINIMKVAKCCKIENELRTKVVIVFLTSDIEIFFFCLFFTFTSLVIDIFFLKNSLNFTTNIILRTLSMMIIIKSRNPLATSIINKNNGLFMYSDAPIYQNIIDIYLLNYKKSS